MYHYIAIERQFCSGGQEIAEQLAKKLGYKLCDHSILVKASENLNLPAIYISNLEETAEGGALSNLYRNAYGSSSKKNQPLSAQIFEAEKEIILHEAAMNDCVFVGRCAGKALESLVEKTLRVFIYADMSYRVERAETVEQISKDKIQAELKRMDNKRSDFFNMYSGSKWGSKDFFHISLNSSALGIEKCVDILMAAAGAPMS